MPGWQSLAQKAAEKNIELINVSLDFQGPEKVIPYLDEYGVKIKTFIDTNGSFANDGSSYFRTGYVRIDNFSDSSIDMLVQCFTNTTDWNKFIEIKENLAMKIKEIVENEKAGFAFPSQSIYVESTPNNNEEILKK